MKRLPKLKILNHKLTIYRFASTMQIPDEVYKSNFFSITKTEDELSVVCESSIDLDPLKAEEGWSAFKVLGPLDFSLTGILYGISNVLAEAKISIFAVSTFDTDYILVRSENLAEAVLALEGAGYKMANQK